MKLRECTINVAKTKALISSMVIMQLICAFVWAYANRRFSHDKFWFLFLYPAVKRLEEGDTEEQGTREQEMELKI